METHRDDVEEVVVSERVQYGGDRLPGDGQPQALHAATHIHQDHHVFGGRRRLNVPGETSNVVLETRTAAAIGGGRTGGFLPLPVPAVKADDAVLVGMPLDS